MKKIALALVAVVLCITLTGCDNDPAISNDGKLVLDDLMISFIETGFEDSSGKYNNGTNPNCQRILTRANKMILEMEQSEGIEIDYQFVDYEMHSYSKVDDYNYVVKITLKGKNGAGEYSYIDTDAYLFCVKGDTVVGFELQVHCDGLQEKIEKLK